MAKFSPRTSEPGASNKYYVNYSKGGYNTAIVINSSNGYVIPNCVGYAQGRFREIRGDKTVWSTTGSKLAGNAETFFNAAKNAGMSVGQVPKLGAIIVWEGKGSAAGHVAVVEQINKDSNGKIVSIVTSNSAYNGTHFYMQTLTAASGFLYVTDGSRPLLGFIYCDIDFEENTPAQPQAQPQPSVKYSCGDVVKLNAGAKWSNGSSPASWVYNCDLTIKEIRGTILVVSKDGFNGGVTGTVETSNVYTVKINSTPEPVKPTPAPSNPTPEPTKPTAAPSSKYAVGDIVKLNDGAKWSNNSSPASWVYAKDLTILRIDDGNKLVVSKDGAKGGVTGVVNASDVHKASANVTKPSTPTIQKKDSLNKGEKVHFVGNTHYVSSYANAQGKPASACNAEVTAINTSKSSSVVRHYHLVGSGVYGWVNDSDIAELK